MGDLSAEDFAGLEKLQTKVRDDDGGAEQRRAQAVTRMANEALRSVGIDPTPRPDAAPGSDAAQSAMFHHLLQDELAAFENSKGRKPTEAEAYDVVAGLKDTAIKCGWIVRRDRQVLLALGSSMPSANDAFEKRHVLPARDRREESIPPATSADSDIRQASLADGPSESQDDREARLFGGPIRRGVPPVQKIQPKWREDFSIPEFPKPTEPPAPKPHEAPVPDPGNRIALPQYKLESPSR